MQADDTGTLDDRWAKIVAEVAKAAEITVHAKPVKANKPWISARTLETLDQKCNARASVDWSLEEHLRKLAREQAKEDRARWLADLVADGNWPAIKRLRRGPRVQQGRLKKR